MTVSIGCNVFFYIDKPTCFLCFSSEHFRKDCLQSKDNSKSSQQSGNNSVESNVGTGLLNDQEGIVASADKVKSREPLSKEGNLHFSDVATADSTRPLPQSQLKELTFAETLVNVKTNIAISIGNKKEFLFSSGFKRRLSDSSSKTSNFQKNSLSTGDTMALNLNDFPRISDFKIGTKQKKIRKEDTKSPEEISFPKKSSFSIASGLERARATIEATTEKHHLKFDTFVELLGKIHGLQRTKKRSIVETYTHNFSELTRLIDIIYGMTIGKSIKSWLRSLKNSIGIESESLNDTSFTDTSMVSDSD